MQQGRTASGFFILAVYLFLVFSRLQEYLATFVGTGFFLSLIFGGLAFLFTLLSGRLRPLFASKQGMLLVGFTAWLMLATAMSTWKTGSLNLLTQYWFKSLITFIVTAAMISTVAAARQAAYTVAFACMVAELATVLLGSNQSGRFELADGSLGNANGLAFHIIMALPFLYLLLAEGSAIWKLVASVALVEGMLVVIKTGSRAGLIELTVLMLLVFFRLSLAKKLVFGAAAAGLAVVGLTLTPQETIDRYRALVSDQASSRAYASAVESEESRWERLTTSLKVTVEHPLFGVGPGVFASATAEEEKREGRVAVWRQTHNAYTQLSAEAGIPALLLYLAAMISCLTALFRLYRRTRRQPEARSISNIALCVLLSLVMFALNGITDSNAYQYYFPFLAGLTVAFVAAAESELADPCKEAPAAAMASVRMPSTPPVPVWVPATNAIRVPGGSRLNRKLNSAKVPTGTRGS